MSFNFFCKLCLIIQGWNDFYKYGLIVSHSIHSMLQSEYSKLQDPRKKVTALLENLNRQKVVKLKPDQPDWWHHPPG